MTLSPSKQNFNWKDCIAPFLLLFSVFNIGYNLTNRADIYILWLYLAFAFLGYFIILFRINKTNFLKIDYYTAIFCRLALMFSVPLLSDDIYRFIWDGSQILHGINPFDYTPTELMNFHFDWIDISLFQKMNSPDYYSVYPPINQFAFLLSALPGKGQFLASVVALRLFILVFEFGNIYIIKKILIHLKKDERLVFWYALNPLVILEFTGNLHFEAVMIFFTLLSFYLLLKNKWILASFALALAICSKLLPLIFLPLFINQIGWRKSIYAGLICGVAIIILFLPFIYNLTLVSHLINSLQLYYGKFEFNGSIYQLLKAIGWKILGYNPIAYTSKILLFFSLACFIYIYIKCKNLIKSAFLLIFIYLIFGAIVHPWYILILIAFTPFVKWRFAALWSILICLSYYTYHVVPYQESLILVGLEYGLLGLFMIYELRLRKT